jgi:hypothetical protein
MVILFDELRNDHHHPFPLNIKPIKMVFVFYAHQLISI